VGTNTPWNHVWKKSASQSVLHIRSHEGRYVWGGAAGSGGPIAAEYAACVDIGRGLHSFPFPLNLSLLCPFPLDLSTICRFVPHIIQINPWLCPEGAQVEL
jgi:hypothetical protein